MVFDWWCDISSFIPQHNNLPHYPDDVSFHLVPCRLSTISVPYILVLLCFVYDIGDGTRVW